jgi:type IV secretion system protein VirD4
VERDGLSPGEALLLTAAVALLAFGCTVWAGAALSAWTLGQDFSASFGDAVDAGLRLPAHMSDPASAWRAPIGRSLPGPAVYWPLTASVALVMVVALGAAMRIVRRRVGTAQREPLGVDARSRFATARDLAPMLIRRPETGRFVLGRVGRRLVATEKPSRRRRRGRASDRGAVALIGPSRSGKTTAAVGGILDWHGPAVLSSVKADLLATTYTWRAGRGEVLVYDPTRTTGMATASWTPLREAGSIIGAQRAARSLCDAAPRGDNVEGGLDFWLTQAEILLSGLLWVAANKSLDMAAVCEWVMVQDSPSEASKGQVKTFVDELISDDDEEVRDGAAQAARSLLSVWRMEERTRSSVYATAQSVVWPWADPGVAAASKGIGVNLDWLLESERTVYLCAPIEDQQRLSPAFGGLLNDIIRQVYLKVARTNRPLDPPLLARTVQ